LSNTTIQNKFHQLGENSPVQTNEPMLLHLSGCHIRESGIKCGEYHTHLMSMFEIVLPVKLVLIDIYSYR
jgi:hypothetical protein